MGLNGIRRGWDERVDGTWQVERHGRTYPNEVRDDLGFLVCVHGRVCDEDTTDVVLAFSVPCLITRCVCGVFLVFLCALC